eukprot:SM015269S01450  [mRNA]  locus=s15269:2:295:- [translate_table: standard]
MTDGWWRQTKWKQAWCASLAQATCASSMADCGRWRPWPSFTRCGSSSACTGRPSPIWCSNHGGQRYWRFGRSKSGMHACTNLRTHASWTSTYYGLRAA